MAGKSYTFDEDDYLRAYEGVPVEVLARDIGRSLGSVKARIRFLKESGAWDHLVKIAGHRAMYEMKANKRLSPFAVEGMLETGCRAGLIEEATF